MMSSGFHCSALLPGASGGLFRPPARAVKVFVDPGIVGLLDLGQGPATVTFSVTAPRPGR